MARAHRNSVSRTPSCYPQATRPARGQPTTPATEDSRSDRTQQRTARSPVQRLYREWFDNAHTDCHTGSKPQKRWDMSAGHS